MVTPTDVVIVKSAICKDWPPAKFMFQTNRVCISLESQLTAAVR